MVEWTGLSENSACFSIRRYNPETAPPQPPGPPRSAPDPPRDQPNNCVWRLHSDPPCGSPPCPFRASSGRTVAAAGGRIDAAVRRARVPGGGRRLRLLHPVAAAPKREMVLKGQKLGTSPCVACVFICLDGWSLLTILTAVELFWGEGWGRHPNRPSRPV